MVTGGGENDATLRVWDPKTGACSGTIQGAHFHRVGALLFMTSSALEICRDTPTALDTSAALETALVSRMPVALCAVHHHTSVTSTGWEASAFLRVYSMLCAGLTALGVYTDSATVLTGAEDGSAFLSNVQSGRILGQLHGTRSQNHPITFRPQSTHIWQVPAEQRG